jgi:valyl-tRNA synthetase
MNELASIKSLSGKNAPAIIPLSSNETPPTGCVVFVVSAEVVVFLEVKGSISIDSAILKAEAKLKKAADAATKLSKIISAPDFADKSSKAVQEVEAKRLAELQAQQLNYERSIEQFKQMKLAGSSGAA